MKYQRLLVSFIGLLSHHTAFSAAYQFYELGTPVIGTAGSGQAALANDASTAYFNPAGMEQLETNEFMLGSQLIVPYTNFSRNRATTISGDNGGEAATLTPGLDIYSVYSITSKLKLGASLTSPYGGMLNYNDGWVGRYIVQDTQFYTLDLDPVIAYQFNDKIAIGGGLVVEYANLQQTVALPLKPHEDGQLNIKANNTDFGLMLGVLLTPTETTKIGVNYHSKITHHLKGNSSFLRINATPATATQMISPQNVVMSISQKVTDKWSLLGDVGWSNWAVMQNTFVTVLGFTSTTPLDWKNTYRLGLGSQYQFTSNLLFQAGVSYDSSPIDTLHRLPDLPMDSQLRVGTGVIYAPIEAIKMGFSYEYIHLGSAPINNTSFDGRLVGSYSRNIANVLQVSINVRC